MNAFSMHRAAPRVVRDARREEIEVRTGRRQDPSDALVRTGAMLDTVTEYAAPIAGAATGLALGVLAFGGKLGMTLGLGAAGGLAGYFLGKPSGQ